uniref:Uncharacterized protein n=1 Tax=Rhizophora mucronata TaxID=61149 RepID=A0A2P2JAF4_RHIMU
MPFQRSEAGKTKLIRTNSPCCFKSRITNREKPIKEIVTAFLLNQSRTNLYINYRSVNTERESTEG